MAQLACPFHFVKFFADPDPIERPIVMILDVGSYATILNSAVDQTHPVNARIKDAGHPSRFRDCLRSVVACFGVIRAVFDFLKKIGVSYLIGIAPALSSGRAV